MQNDPRKRPTPSINIADEYCTSLEAMKFKLAQELSATNRIVAVLAFTESESKHQQQEDRYLHDRSCIEASVELRGVVACKRLLVDTLKKGVKVVALLFKNI